MNPLKKFKLWYREALEQEPGRIPSACCLSTMGLDGYPNARFVSLKDVNNGRFIITGPQDSRKGLELKETPRAALTFWWASAEKQVRIQGCVCRLENSEADRYFRDRPGDSQIISWASKQGQPLYDSKILEMRTDHLKKLFSDTNIPRPSNWSGVAIDPVRIEFFEFREDRHHLRILYIKQNNRWEKQLLQP